VEEGINPFYNYLAALASSLKLGLNTGGTESIRYSRCFFLVVDGKVDIGSILYMW